MEYNVSTKLCGMILAVEGHSYMLREQVAVKSGPYVILGIDHSGEARSGIRAWIR
jgi:type IV secretory pathway TrbF-like protein